MVTLLYALLHENLGQILKMKEISKKFNSDFMLVILDWNDRFSIDQYESFFKKNEIKFVNCSVSLIDQMVLPGDYHPSEKAHTYYDECITNYINKKKLVPF